MASEEKLVRLSYKQLRTLSEKYTHDGKKRPDKRAPKETRKEREDRDRTARRNKRPDREIYQPGRTRLNPKKADGDFPDDPGSLPENTDTKDNSHAPDLQSRNQEDTDQSSHQQHSGGHMTGAEHSESNTRRRNKRPEMQRYVPKVKLDHQSCNAFGRPQEQNEQSTVAEDISLHDKNQHSPVSPQRRVDLKKMVVTLQTEEKDPQSPSSEASDKQPNFKKDTTHPLEAKQRLHNLSSEHLGNLSDVSHDSLEWDYASVDAELASLDINREDAEGLDPWLTSPADLSHPGQGGTYSQGSSDRGQRGRRRRDCRRGRGGRGGEHHGLEDSMFLSQERKPVPGAEFKEHAQQHQQTQQPLSQHQQPQQKQQFQQQQPLPQQKQQLQQQPLPQRDPPPQRGQRQRRYSKPEHSVESVDESKPRRPAKESEAGNSQSKVPPSSPVDKQVSLAQKRPEETVQIPQSQRKPKQEKESSQQRKKSQDHNKRGPQGVQGEERQNQRHKGHDSGDGRHNAKQGRKSSRQDSSGSDEVWGKDQSEDGNGRKPQGVTEDKPGRDSNNPKRADVVEASGPPQGRRRQESIGEENGKGNKRGKRNRGRGDRDGERPKRDNEKDSGQGKKEEIGYKGDEYSRAPLEREDIGKDDGSPVGKDGKKISLKVTFAQNNERLVKVQRSASHDEMDLQQMSQAHHHHHHSQHPPPHGHPAPLSPATLVQPERPRGGGRGGGIIRLPPPPQETFDRKHVVLPPHTSPIGIQSAPRPIVVPSQAWGPAQPQGRGGRPTRGRGGSHRTLYDPNHPNKSLVSTSPQQLLFQDPYDMPRQHMDSSAFPAGFSPQAEYFYNYPYYDYGSDFSSSPKQGDAFYNYPPQYFDSGVYADNTHEDPYYRSNDQESSTRSCSSNRGKAESFLRDVVPLENQLGNLLSRRIHGDEGIQKILSLRQEVQVKYSQIVLLDPDVSNKHNVEQGLWKSAFYQIIEIFRRMIMEEEEDKEKAKQHLLALLEEGTTFYEEMLKNLQNTYGFQLDDFTDSNQLPPETLTRSVKLALLSAQRTMICLGDIARYREQTNRTTNYGKARSWYLKAQQIAPKNGRPYNQLAILALYTRRKLDAVYYYMRSLAASNPFLTARESLMSLFDEARKKAEVSERKKQEEKRQKKQEEILKSRDGNRIEIWVNTDGTSSVKKDEDLDDLSVLSAIELNKRFVLSFMNVHGKLFTKVGRETFPEVSSEMLYEFKTLLQNSPPPIGNQRLLQLMTINMHAIENTAPKEGTVEENCRSLVQEQAVQLGLEMFGLLLQRSIALLRAHLSSTDFQVLNEDLHQLIPSVKVWADWMTCHAPLWNPPPHSRDPSLGPVIDTWAHLAELCNVLKEVDITHVKLYTQKKEGCDPVVLSEDVILAGFVPLLSLPQIPVYVHSTVEKEVAKDCLRVEKLRTFGDYLCGIEPPLLSYNVETHRYESIYRQDADNTDGDDTLDSSKDDDVIIESETEIEEDSTPEDGSHINQLKAKRDQLQRRVDERERQRDQRHALLNSDNNLRPIEIEVHPIFLVPDTNGFIDHLDSIRNVVGTDKYTMVLPLVVINELDGLTRGSRDGQYSTKEHAEMVKRHAVAAVGYIEEQFEARNSRVRALTSKGSLLDSIAFRSEETQEGGNNDDLILSCCLHYCQDKARDFMPHDKDTPIRLRREVVLLTDDRNLRLKAHTRNVPVKDIPAFSKWAKIT